MRSIVYSYGDSALYSSINNSSNSKFYMQRIQEKQNDPTSRYNLFCQQPAVFSKTVRSPKPEKTQLKIVFQHPNLLYLSDKRVKSKQEISEEVEKRLLQMIKNKIEKKIKFNKNGRPATSYFTYEQNHADQEGKVEPFRCMTSIQSGRVRKRRNYPLQQGLASIENQGCLGQNSFDIENRQKDKNMTRSYFKKPKQQTEPRLNMYIEMQRRIFNYKNRTRKSNIKKQRHNTLQNS